MRRIFLGAAALLLAACSGPTDPAVDPETGENIYANGDKWLCLPGREDACTGDWSASVIHADGSATIEPFTANPDAPFDCFYVYPTVSTDLSGNSDWDVDIQETGVAQIQLARFGNVCKLYAPVYRQITLTALASDATSFKLSRDVPMADADVKAAWDYYLQNYNNGRGVVLLGHSQGSYRLGTLIQKHIEGQPVQSQIIGAHILGANIPVTKGAKTGGSFEHFPRCTTRDEIGCFTNIVSFRETAPPPAGGSYGYARNEAEEIACVNPAAPQGGKVVLDAIVPSRKLTADRTASAQNTIQWSEQHPTVETNFVRVPGLLSGECVNKGGASYFAVTINADPDDPRTDEMAGDLIVDGELYPGWGLHLIDMNLVLGDLVEMVRLQGEAYLAN